MRTPSCQKKWRIRLCQLARVAGWLVLLVLVLVLFWLRGAIYNRFVRFPQQEAA